MNCKRIGILTAVGAAAVAIGTGIAAAQPDDGEGSPITGEALAKASQAALAFTGGGTSQVQRSATRRASTRSR